MKNIEKMADEPVSRILRATLKTRNLLIRLRANVPMMLIPASTEGFLSQFLSHSERQKAASVHGNK
jgi:hypothetical protein